MYEDAGLYALEVMEALVRIHKADSFEDVDEGFRTVLNVTRRASVEKYEMLANQQTNELRSDLHDDRVRAQGGL